MNLKELLKSKDQIYRPDVIKSILKSYNISLKKRFGQNFLINKSLADYIIKLLVLRPSDRVVEIGPGLGAITLLLAEKAKQVVAFEIDRGVFNILNDIIKVFNIKNILLINEDFLRLSDKSKEVISNFDKMVSNFPYSTGQRMVIESIEKFDNIKQIVGTLQREVADRFISSPGNKNYGFISAWIRYISNISLKKIVSPENFFPKPEVDSAIVEIIPKLPDNIKLENMKVFIKCCFMNKRKSLVNNILSCKNLANTIIFKDKQLLIRKVKELFGDEKIRAEKLSSFDFNKLYNELSNLRL